MTQGMDPGPPPDMEAQLRPLKLGQLAQLITEVRPEVFYEAAAKFEAASGRFGRLAGDLRRSVRTLHETLRGELTTGIDEVTNRHLRHIDSVQVPLQEPGYAQALTRAGDALQSGQARLWQLLGYEKTVDGHEVLPGQPGYPHVEVDPASVTHNEQKAEQARQIIRDLGVAYGDAGRALTQLPATASGQILVQSRFLASGGGGMATANLPTAGPDTAQANTVSPHAVSPTTTDVVPAAGEPTEMVQGQHAAVGSGVAGAPIAFASGGIGRGGEQIHGEHAYGEDAQRRPADAPAATGTGAAVLGRAVPQSFSPQQPDQGTSQDPFLGHGAGLPAMSNTAPNTVTPRIVNGVLGRPGGEAQGSPDGISPEPVLGRTVSADGVTDPVAPPDEQPVPHPGDRPVTVSAEADTGDSAVADGSDTEHAPPVRTVFEGTAFEGTALEKSADEHTERAQEPEPGRVATGAGDARPASSQISVPAPETQVTSELNRVDPESRGMSEPGASATTGGGATGQEWTGPPTGSGHDAAAGRQGPAGSAGAGAGGMPMPMGMGMGMGLGSGMGGAGGGSGDSERYADVPVTAEHDVWDRPGSPDSVLGRKPDPVPAPEEPPGDGSDSEGRLEALKERAVEEILGRTRGRKQ